MWASFLLGKSIILFKSSNVLIFVHAREETAPFVLRCPGAVYRRLNDRDAALKAYRFSWSQGLVRLCKLP